ncbi:uL30 family ribosomal protein [Candidatus Woesearchaeota archaeon]|nr:uL30 family ribosomal protein [Candidatus Woesearchaeota archaeon]
MAKIAVILVRGMINVKPDIRKTVKLLNLSKKNTCIVLSDTEQNKGMVKKVKDYVTYGPLDAETEKLLLEKRGKDKEATVFQLAPPVKGFGRKGIKKPFNVGGGLGDRKEHINELIKRMI